MRSSIAPTPFLFHRSDRVCPNNNPCSDTCKAIMRGRPTVARTSGIPATYAGSDAIWRLTEGQRKHARKFPCSATATIGGICMKELVVIRYHGNSVRNGRPPNEGGWTYCTVPSR